MIFVGGGEFGARKQSFFLVDPVPPPQPGDQTLIQRLHQGWIRISHLLARKIYAPTAGRLNKPPRKEKGPYPVWRAVQVCKTGPEFVDGNKSLAKEKGRGGLGENSKARCQV